MALGVGTELVFGRFMSCHSACEMQFIGMDHPIISLSTHASPNISLISTGVIFNGANNLNRPLHHHLSSAVDPGKLPPVPFVSSKQTQILFVLSDNQETEVNKQSGGGQEVGRGCRLADGC